MSVPTTDKHMATVARMRRLAAELRWANAIYLHDLNHGAWSPTDADREANHLEVNP